MKNKQLNVNRALKVFVEVSNIVKEYLALTHVCDCHKIYYFEKIVNVYQSNFGKKSKGENDE